MLGTNAAKEFENMTSTQGRNEEMKAGRAGGRN
jgi:hypothetical protein